jgi:ferredoxin--NADP+ reductase
LAIGDDEKRINRPYSVASPFGGPLEFFIVMVDGGALTPHLWRMEVGDKLQISQRAAGSFTLTKTPVAEVVWLISTGTGLAPYIAMLRTDEPWKRFKKIVVVHGTRLAVDLAYTDELLHYRKENGDQLRLIQAVTREQSDGLLTGRIPALLDSGELEKAAGVEMLANNSAVLLCGNPAMLDEMETKLEQRQMKKHRAKSPGHIVVERYW